MGLVYLGKESVTIPVPCFEQFGLLASRLSPWVAISQGGVNSKCHNGKCQKYNSPKTAKDRVLTETDARHTSCDIVVYLTQCHDREVKCWEIVMQEELALHQVEWEVMESPCQDHSTNFVVEALENWIVVILVSTLPAENCHTFEDSKDSDCQGRAPPDNWVSNEVNLSIVLTPEVDTTSEDRPGWWSRIPCVRLNEPSIGVPHDLLQLPELPKEARVLVVDLLGRLTELWMLVLFDIPNAVRQGSSFGAGDFLLLRCPFRKLNLVREQNTASHDVNELEFGLDSPKTLLGFHTIRRFLDDFDSEVIIGITLETFVTIGRYLVLPISLSDRRTNIVGVESAMRCQVVELDGVAIFDEFGLAQGVPSK
jgi:hypothetical protein